jgi:uncharacterized membrane protein YbhN (UPF0104 family)
VTPTVSDTAADDPPAGEAGVPATAAAGGLGGFLARHRRLLVAVQVVVVLIVFGFAGWAAKGDFGDARDGLARANLREFVVGCAFVGAYYLVFVLGWMKILRDWRVRISYGTALRSEMVSMLAKYVPGGVWTPAARMVAMRREGVTDTALVGAAMFVEAALSAVSGVLVFVLSLGSEKGADVPLAPLLAFTTLLVVLLHPRIFNPLASRLVRRFGGDELPPVRWGSLLLLLVFYSFTWVVGGLGLLFIVRAVGNDPHFTSVAFLGGVSAVGAIVGVLAFFAPSGLGFREATMYGLLLGVTTSGAALAATALNRIAITVVEALLFLVAGVGPWLARRARRRPGADELDPR